MDMKVGQPTGPRKGFEYHNKIWVDDEILSKYPTYLEPDEGNMNPIFILVITTNFILKKKPENTETILDMEKFVVAPRAGMLQYFWVRRFRDYWMSNHEIQDLLRAVILFGEHRSHIIPVAVEIDVCTVQQEGETIAAAMERAITPRSLYPLHLYPENQTAIGLVAAHKFFLRDRLPTIRVREDADRALMEECPICLHNPTIGTQISRLRCGHAFHNHCVVRWLQNNRSCPMCRCPVYDSNFREICAKCRCPVDECSSSRQPTPELRAIVLKVSDDQ